jgi:hypothetical protein
MQVKIFNFKIDVANIQEASKLVRQTIDNHNIGSLEWYQYKSNGSLYTNGKKSGYISFNGRAWKKENQEIII